VKPPESFLELPVAELLERVAARTPAPGGGSVAALVASLAAGLVAMAARFAPDDWGPRSEAVERADALGAEVTPLADEDARAYAGFLETGELEPTVAIPLALAAAATELAELGARVAADGNPRVSGDAAAGAALAAAAAHVAARLVALNLAGTRDERIDVAAALARRAEAAAGSAMAAGDAPAPT